MKDHITGNEKNEAAGSELDAFGTSQTQGKQPGFTSDKQSGKLYSYVPEQAKPDRTTNALEAMRQKALKTPCINHAPFIAIPPKDGQPARVFSGTCNNWNCPRCGVLRAQEEYARICEGVKDLMADGHRLYMVTITCRGDQTVKQAEDAYLDATNRFVTVWRKRAKAENRMWAYVAVTERQKRGHPHSHMIATYLPPDAFFIHDDYQRYVREVARLNRQLPLNMRFSPRKPNKIKDYEMFSYWLSMRAFMSGLGVQISIGRVQSPKAVVLYLAKYLFKSAQQTEWPKGWRRVRYSRSWSKLERENDTEAFPLLSREDWNRLSTYRDIVTSCPVAYKKCFLMGIYHVKALDDFEPDDGLNGT